ncbi:MAG: hypothetical protein L3J37_04505 [Rhodobacteraceae bacterium]|nr:hypothetical protein [Paracoccaceae bacterium]
MKQLLTSLLAMAALLISPSYAQSLFPSVPKALGEPHPEGNEYWRINHPALLAHDRDLVVLEGIRDVDASLTGCVVCHAVNGPDQAPVQSPVSADSPDNSCRVCHEYVAVKIGCFTCHASVPAMEDVARILPEYSNSDEGWRAYLEDLSNLQRVSQ